MAEQTFKRQLKSGLFYTALAKYSGIVISLGVTAILSRLLEPKDFGTIAVATVFIVFFSIFSDMGISAAIIQKRELSKTDISSLYSFSVILGIILSGIFFSSSWLIGRLYTDDQLVPLCQLLSINILFATWNIVPNGILFRDKLFKFIGIRTVSIQIFLAVISIVTAYYGWGVYALLINPIGSSILIYLFSYSKCPIKFTLRPQINSIKKIASYSSYTFGFTLINYFTRNLDKLFIGRVFGMTSLGYYEKSYRLMLLPVQNLTHVITPVLHPVLADYQTDISIQTEKYLKLVFILAVIGFPLSCFLYFSAESLVILIFGNQWLPSVPVFKILSLSIGLQITGSTTGAFFQATNMTRQMFWIGCINTLINVTGLMIGLYMIKTIEGVAWMWTLTLYIGLWNLWYIANTLNISTIMVFKPYLYSIMPSVITAVLLLLINNIHLSSLFVSLLINGFITCVIILIFMRVYKIFDIYNYFQSRITLIKHL